jgi:hypothetical protein
MDYVALIIGLIILITQSDKVNFKSLKLDRPTIIFACSLVLIIISGIGIYNTNILNKKREKRERYSKDVGTLNPKTKKKSLLWEVNGDTIEYKNGVFDMTYNPLFKNAVFKTWIEDGQVYVTTDVRDSIGDLIARIVRNEWVVNPQQRLDKNFDNSALEVIDNSGTIIFQVEIKDNILRLQGLFYFSAFEAVIVRRFMFPNRPLTLAFFASSEDEGYKLPIPMQPQMVGVIPLFKYPSYLHMGDRIKH